MLKGLTRRSWTFRERLELVMAGGSLRGVGLSPWGGSGSVYGRAS